MNCRRRLERFAGHKKNASRINDKISSTINDLSESYTFPIRGTLSAMDSIDEWVNAPMSNSKHVQTALSNEEHRYFRTLAKERDLRSNDAYRLDRE